MVTPVLTEEDEDGTGERRQLHFLGDQLVKSVDAEIHSYMTLTNIEAHAVVQSKHTGSSF